MKRLWKIVGHHRIESEQRFCLTVQRNGHTKIIQGVSLSVYCAAVSGEIQEIALPLTEEDIRALEQKAAEFDAKKEKLIQ